MNRSKGNRSERGRNKGRQAKNRRKQLNRRLAGYAATAGAALAIAASGGNAEGSVIVNAGFSGPQSVTVPENRDVNGLIIPPFASFLDIDLNADATVDFRVQAGNGGGAVRTANDFFNALSLLAGTGNFILTRRVGTASQTALVNRLPRSYQVGAAPFLGTAGLLASRNVDTFSGINTGAGDFLGKRGLIGVAFNLVDGLHFGFIDFHGANDAGTGTIFGWAFESTPDTPIHAEFVPEPTSLAAWAAGAATALGIAALRRWRRRAEAPGTSP